MKDWAIVALGGFGRLGPHKGALHALTSAFKEGKLLKEPSYIVTSSVAAIPASIYVQQSEEKFVKTEKMVIDLKKRQFVDLHPQLKKNAVIDFLITSGLLYGAYRAGKLAVDHPYVGAAMLAGLLPAVYKIDEKAVKDIFRAPSFLVYDNLHKFLYKILSEDGGFDAIFNSPIKIEIPAVNINKAGWRLPEILAGAPLYRNSNNKGWVSVTNFKPEDVNLEKEARNINYLLKMINGKRIQGHFNAGRHDNDDAIFDTATLSNMPLHFAINRGYKNIVILHYNSKAEGPTERVFDNWTESVNRCWDLSVAEKTKETMLGCLRINNDLKQLDKQMKSLDDLAAWLSYSPPGTYPGLEETLKSGREATKSYSFSDKREVNILVVGSRPISDIHFADVGGDSYQDDMIEGINAGSDAGWAAVPEINKMIEAV